MNAGNADSPLPAGHAPSPPPDRADLRRTMRRRRQSLTIRERDHAASAVARIVSRMNILRPGRRVALYVACRGEVDLSPVIAIARQRRCELFLPVITSFPRARMEFVRFETDGSLRRNPFGIEEPRWNSHHRIEASRLDLVLLPLVAADARGWRIGSGAGFYDRRLRHLRTGRRWRRPRLIGIAYDFQRVPRIDPQPWDVPLDGIVTERAFYAAQRPLASPRHE